eukprot:SAG31_NODE_1054_length_10140_cov_4.264316_3_plen_46_part_00
MHNHRPEKSGVYKLDLNETIFPSQLHRAMTFTAGGTGRGTSEARG